MEVEPREVKQVEPIKTRVPGGMSDHRKIELVGDKVAELVDTESVSKNPSGDVGLVISRDKFSYLI